MSAVGEAEGGEEAKGGEDAEKKRGERCVRSETEQV